jgi:hypothetical protein
MPVFCVAVGQHGVILIARLRLLFTSAPHNFLPSHQRRMQYWYETQATWKLQNPAKPANSEVLYGACIRQAQPIYLYIYDKPCVAAYQHYHWE